MVKKNSRLIRVGEGFADDLFSIKNNLERNLHRPLTLTETTRILHNLGIDLRLPPGQEKREKNPFL